MPSVALIGVDGAGKSTIARMLAERFPDRIKLLYMGINPDSANVCLPTSRMIAAVRRRSKEHSKIAVQADTHGAFWAFLRTLNRFAEEWYRQALSFHYQKAGYLVLFDRHYRFDFAFDPHEKYRLSERIHRWMLAHLYPSPDLVIFLHAPAEVLFSRKHEWDVATLERRSQLLSRQKTEHRNFVQIDASQPLEQVYAEVSEEIRTFCETL